MAQTILLLVLVVALITFLFWVSLKETKLSRRGIIITTIVCTVFIILFFVNIGIDKVCSEITKVIRNASPKEPMEVYNLLFKEAKRDCVKVINFKDQIIPKIDCCIWMELKVCPTELNRILSLKNYKKLSLKYSDSTSFLTTFDTRPIWWVPQKLDDSLIKYSIKFNQNQEQTLFVGNDSSHIFLCDQAL